MGLLFIVFLGVFISSATWAVLKLIAALNEIDEKLAKLNSLTVHYRNETNNKITDLNAELAKIKQMLVIIRDEPRSQTDAKKNNWDSVRAAFSTPNKSDLND